MQEQDESLYYEWDKDPAQERRVILRMAFFFGIILGLDFWHFKYNPDWNQTLVGILYFLGVFGIFFIFYGPVMWWNTLKMFSVEFENDGVTFIFGNDTEQFIPYDSIEDIRAKYHSVLRKRGRILYVITDIRAKIWWDDNGKRRVLKLKSSNHNSDKGVFEEIIDELSYRTGIETEIEGGNIRRMYFRYMFLFIVVPIALSIAMSWFS